jgi:hypothetical protein
MAQQVMALRAAQPAAVQLRFRIGTSSCCPTSGWRLDDIAVSGDHECAVPAFVSEPTKCGSSSTSHRLH